MRKVIPQVCALLLVVLLSSCDKQRDYRHFDGSVWATTFHITYRSDKSLDDSIMLVMKEVELSLSPFCDSSLVSGANRMPGGTVRADSLFVRVFDRAMDVCRASKGLYDPTVGPLVDLWGFGRKKDVTEPTASEIDSALAGVGLTRCSIVNDMIMKPSPSTRFDFSSITKGYGCDLVGEMLQRNGCSDYMVEIGGEMALKGVNPRGKKWQVMIEAPSMDNPASGGDGVDVVPLSDCGVATSGNYRNFRHVTNGIVGHTISPLTGRPVLTTTLSATVIASDCMTADALATACMAMPLSEALRMVEEFPGAEAMLVTSSPKGAETPWSIHRTKGFPVGK